MRRVDHLLALIGLQRIRKPSVHIDNVYTINAHSLPDVDRAMRQAMASAPSPEVLAAQSLHAARKRSKADQLRISQARVIANIRAAESA